MSENKNNASSMIESLGAIGEMTLIYYRAILGAGGTPEEALVLTREYLYVLVHPKRMEEQYGTADI